VYLSDINVTKSLKNNTMVNSSGIDLWEEKKYVDLIKKVIITYHRNKARLINNEDFITFLLYYAVCGHMRYDSSSNLSIERYIIYCINQGAKKYFSEYIKQKKKSGTISELNDKIALFNKTEYSEDNFNEILSNSNLTKHEHECVSRRILTSDTFEQISNDLSLTKQRVHQIYNAGLNKIKKYVISE